MRIARIFLLVALLATIGWADVVVLKDGTRLEGEVKRAGGNWQITTADGKVVEISPDKVKSIEISANGSGAPSQATSGLASLRRSVENVSDIRQIIDRFKRFIEQYKGTPAAVDAQGDLDLWQQRADQGLVKLGSRWVTPAERTQAADKALGVAEQARQLIAHGRIHDGDQLLNAALESDPQCPPALYLRGVVQFQQHQLQTARKAFESVAAIITDHAPTLNNLAIILWQQNAIMPALAHYEQAMTAAPVNRPILDNVAEALALVPDEQKKNIVAQRVYRAFVEQDTRLQEAMAAEGMYRWGGAWVDRATMESYRKLESEINEKLTAAKADFDAADKQVKAIDAQIDTIEQSLQQMRNDSVQRDSKGNLIKLPLPLSYYDLQNQESQLKSDRATAASKQASARDRVKTLEAQKPKPKFTGIQKLIGAEGTPVMLAPGQAPITQPTTQSTTQPTTAPTSQP